MSLLTLLLGLLLPLGLLFGTPGITAPLPAAGLALGGALAVVAGFALDKSERLTAGPIWGCGLLLAGALASLTGASSYQSKEQLSILCAALGTLSALSLAARSRKRWRQACLALVLAASASSAFGWWMLLVKNEGTLGRLSGNWTNPDCFAVIPLCGVFLAGALLGPSAGYRRGGLLLLGAFLAATLVLTLSRSAWAGLLAGILAVLFRAWKIASPSLRDSVYYALCAFVPLLIFLSTSGLWGSVSARWSTTWSSPYDIPLRQEVWTGAARAFLVRPLSGTGPGSFPLTYPQYRPTDTPSLEFMNAAHNDTLQILVETGLLGLFFWLGLHGQAARATLACRQRGWTTQSTWLLGGIVAVFTYSLFNFAWPVPACLVWWFALLGLAFALPAEERDWRGLRNSFGLGAASVLVLAGSLALIFSFRLQQAQSARASAETAISRLDWSEAFSQLSRAVKSEPDKVEHRLQRASLSRDLFALTGDPIWKEQAERDLEAARHSSPRSLPTLSASYRFHLAHAQLKQARDAVAQAIHYAPYEKKFLRYSAGLQALEGDLGHAVTLLLREPLKSEALPPLLYHLQRQDSQACRKVLLQADPQAALDACARTIDLAKQLGDAQAVDQLYSWMSVRSAEPSKLLLQWAMDVGAAGDGERELTLLESALAGIPEGDPLHGQALAKWSRHLGLKSLPRLQKYLELHPEDARVRAALARKLASEKAIPLLEEGLIQRPGEARLLEALGDTYAREGLISVAHDYYQQALESGGEQETLERKLNTN